MRGATGVNMMYNEKSEGEMNMEDGINFALATPKDVEYLRSLAHESEAHWGYDMKFMDVFDCKYNITETFIMSNPV